MGFQIQHRDDMNDDRGCDEDAPIIIEKNGHQETKHHDVDKQFGSGPFCPSDQIGGRPTENSYAFENDAHCNCRDDRDGRSTDNLEDLQDITKWNNTPDE